MGSFSIFVPPSHPLAFYFRMGMGEKILWGVKSSEWQIFIPTMALYLNNKMKSLTAVLLLTLLASSVAQVNILQSSTSTQITTSPAQSSVSSPSFNVSPGSVLGAGISWIQSNLTGPGTKTFESGFYAACTGSATLQISAYATFSAYLDGVLIGSGSDMNTVFKFPLKISCGNHLLRVVVSANFKTPTLIFVIKQDQSKCFNCQATGYWNEQTCKCECINPKGDCACKQPKVWKNYPVCGCGCPTIYSFATRVADATDADATADTAVDAADTITSILPLCLPPKYYNSNTCKCQCHYKYCGPKEYFDPDTCSCWPYIY